MKYLFLFIAVFVSIDSFSQLLGTDSTKTNFIQDIVIDGTILKTTKISKNGLAEMDLPQAISILNSKTLIQQQVANLTDVLKNVNGIYIMGTTGGYQEEIASRGSSISSTNTFKNGIRFFSGMKLEMSGVDKVEILKGNTAIEYGNVAPGGVLNIVTKKPKFEFGGSVDFTLASFDSYKPQIDIYGPLNQSKTLAFRLNGSYQQANSFRKSVSSDAVYVNPSILYRISNKSSLLIEGDFTRSNTVPDFGAGIINYQIVDIPRDRFTGVSWGKYKADQSFVSARYNLNLSKTWDISALAGYRNYATDLFSNVRPSSVAVLADGSWKRSIQRSKVGDNYTIQQVDANANLQTGILNHKILIGADAEQFVTSTTAFNNYSNYDQINIFTDYNPSLEPAAPTMTENTLTKNKVNRFGVYAQDLISFPKYVKIFVGGRFNQINTTADVYTYSTKQSAVTDTKDQPFSPKLGLIVQPNEHHSVFASYSNSFSLNTGVDVNGNALKASIIDQYELGVKNRFLEGNLQVNVTAYQINNSNLAQTSLANGNTNTNIKELAGETQSKGVELDAMYKPLRNLSVILGYSFNETKYTKSNVYEIGSELRYNPKNTANASVNYNFTDGLLKDLNLGVVSQYFGKRYAGRSTRLNVKDDTYKLVPLADYFVVDFVAGYKYKNWSINGKLANILNQLSYNVHDDNSLNPIAPTNFSLQVGFTF